MNKIEYEKYLIDYLLKERNINSNDINYNFMTYRALVNTREPSDIDEGFINIQDKYLKLLLEEKEVIDYKTYMRLNGVYLIQGDITTLNVDCIVNAANKYLLGCFIPNHKCIDNAIHTFSGVQLRNDCNNIMSEQKSLEETGQAKITNSYNLPCKKIIHTVGPIVTGVLTNENKVQLRKSYESCIKIAIENNMKSIAICCISTGEFCFPNYDAAVIAIDVCNKYKNDIDIIFNVFKEEDYEIYNRLLKRNN